MILMKKDEKIITNFEPTDDSDVVNKAYLDEKLQKIDGHFSYIEKDYNEFKLQYHKQSVEEVLFQRAVKAAIQILYGTGLFDNYANAGKVPEDLFAYYKALIWFRESNWWHSMILLKMQNEE